MQFSYRFLKELSGTRRSPEKLAELLLTHAFEVESIEPFAHGLDDIIIGKVVKVIKHPDADRLKVTTVEIKKGETRTIVCGAPNVALGQKVAVALPGGKLPGGMVIKEAELRGVKSQGMICSEKELGLGDSHAGILVLEKDAPVGKSFVHFVGLDDVVLDVKILPDRSCDALSYEGLAREIAALEGFAPAFFSAKQKKPRLKSSTKVPKITLKTDASSRYILASFRGVTIGESPLWLKVRLLTSGLRPINNIVDSTNYLMLRTGQPMHAFDADAIGKSGIVVRMGKPRERLTLLDGKTIPLTHEDVVIADSKKALALAGIMGGKHSAIDTKTTAVAVEIAHFDPVTIRKTRKHLNLFTDASYRFERGIDRDRAGEALLALITLMEDVTYGEYIGSRDVYRHKEKSRKIICTLERVEKVLGTTVPLFEIVQLLALEGLTVKKIANKKELEVIVPSRRPDLADEFDLIEEIGRMRGYDKIAARSPLLPLLPTKSDPKKATERALKELLRGLGFDEVMTYSFYGVAKAEKAGLIPDEHLTVENPMNPEQALMRSSLLPNLLTVAEKNLHHFDTVNVFEWGSTFEKGKLGPIEDKKLALVSLDKKNAGTTGFLALKGKVVALLEQCGIEVAFDPMAKAGVMYHPTRMAALLVQDKTLGFLGELHPEKARLFGLPKGTVFLELDGDLLAALRREGGAFVPLQRFPYAYRDISLIGSKKLVYAEIETLLFEAGAPLLRQATLFDVYEEGDERSYAFHLAFGHPDRTIKSSEMDTLFDTIVKQGEARLGLRLKLA